MNALLLESDLYKNNTQWPTIGRGAVAIPTWLLTWSDVDKLVTQMSAIRAWD